MTADTETIREALEYGAGFATPEQFRVIQAALAALGRVEEREAVLVELLRCSEKLSDSIVLHGGRLIDDHAWKAWITAIAKAAALSSAAGSGEQETAVAAEGTGGYSEPEAPGKNAAPSERGSSSAPHVPSGASMAAGSGEE